MIAKTAYLTVDEAQLYMDGKFNIDAWIEASGGERSRALIEASTILDQIDYLGDKAVNTQEHEFPRLIVLTASDPIQYDSDNVPRIIKYAVCELALAILGGFDRDAELRKNSVVKQDYASAKITYERGTLAPYQKAGIPPEVWTLIQPLVRDQNVLIMSRV